MTTTSKDKLPTCVVINVSNRNKMNARGEEESSSEAAACSCLRKNDKRTHQRRAVRGTFVI